MNIKIKFLIFFLFFQSYSIVSAQFQIPDSLLYRLPQEKINFLIKDLPDTLDLDSLSLFPQSIRFKIENIWLKRGIHYISISPTKFIVRAKGFNPSDTLTVYFRRIPFPIAKNIQPLIPLIKKTKISKGDTIQRVAFLNRFESVFSQNIEGLQKSGTFVRGFQIGNNQNLTLNSSLNLFLKGKISENVSITAALTDENTPIQPEGNTQRLNEVDKVYITLESPYVSGTIGDFDFKSKNGKFEKIQRKLQGVWIKTDNPFGHFEGMFSTTRGNSYQNIFLGQEGNQGPYVLKGKNGEQNIIILAGSERVYVNGELKKRGENFDYVIDYTSGEITFTQNLLISSDMRIEVDFEYIDARQRFLKNFYMLGYGKKSGFFEGRIAFYQEKDDINNILADSAPLSEEEKNLLKQVGDSTDLAIQPGWTQVEKGQGAYVMRDTLINGDSIHYFVYAKDSGNYVVNFTYVGPGKGSYKRERLGYYIFVGMGAGDYEPIIRIPLPQSHQQVVAQLRFKDSTRTQINAEVSLSNLDKNYLSSKNDQDNIGLASSLQGKWGLPVHKILSGLSMNISGYWDHKDSTFNPLDRYYRADYLKYWNQNFLPQSSEDRMEIHNQFQYGKNQYTFSLGLLNLGNVSTTNRLSHTLNGEIKFIKESFESTFLKRNYRNQSDYFEQIKNNVTFFPHHRFSFWQFYNSELKESQFASQVSGYAFKELGLGTRWKHSSLTFESKASTKKDYLFIPDSNYLKKPQASIFQFYSFVDYKKSGKIQSRMTINYRDKDYTSYFESYQGDKISTFHLNPLLQDTTWSDRRSYSIKMNTNLWFLHRQFAHSIEYQVASELTPLKEKVYLKVENQLGNYRFDEELGEYVPDPNGDYILVIAPGRKYIPTSNVNVLWQFNWRPSRRKSADKNIVEKIFSRFTWNQRTKIEEKTTHKNLKDIYLLNLSQFQKEGETIRGSWLTQSDITVFPYHPHWNFLINNRYQKQFLNIYLDKKNNEQRTSLNQSFVLRYRKSVHFKQELEYYHRSTVRKVPFAPERNRNIQEYGFGTTITHRIFTGGDNQLKLFLFTSEDRRESGTLKAHYIKIQDRFTSTIRKKGKFLAMIHYLKVVEDKNPLHLPFPFEMAEGKKPGDNWEWVIRIDYFVSNYLTFSLDYRGRKDAIFKRTIHTGQMELRAYF